MSRRVTRRSFLITGISAACASPLLGRSWFAGRPNEILNVAHIGVGGMGASDLSDVSSAQQVRIVALCDVDRANLSAALQLHPGARPFADFRAMFEMIADEIDAVVVSTPDHMHGPIAIAALELGKHVYVQKPAAHHLAEVRRMTELATEKGLVTQMGVQIHAHEAYRTAVATLRSGVIGKVSEAHLWVSKSWAGPPGGRVPRADPIPVALEWDLWLGVANARPFVQGAYHPANWRGWKDFGTGTLGDMGCHIFDPVFSSLGLGSPRTVISRGPQHYEETFAPDSDIVYEFPGTEQTTETLRLRWTDGGVTRPDAAKAQLPPDESLPGAGSFLVGEHGVMVIPHWSMPRVYRGGKRLELPLEVREGRNHYHEWADACRGEGTTSTPFSYAGPLTESVLLGTIAGRFRDEELRWDSGAMRFGHVGADALVERSYRPDW